MGANSKIEWCEATWTPIRARVRQDAGEIARAKGYAALVQIAERMAGRVGPHCEKVAPGCANCYSENANGRCLPHNGTGLPFDRRARDLVEIFLDQKILQQPLAWRKPRTIFVCSQTDLFGNFVSGESIDQVFAVMALCPQHRFIVLTKRPERMARHHEVQVPGWPLSNVILGVSASDQYTLDAAAPHLLRTSAANRVLSLEPLLGPVSLDSNGILGCGDHTHTDHRCRSVDWVILGGESGPSARPIHPDWARSIRDQCVEAEVPFFFKQWGPRGAGRALDGREWNERPEMLR